MPDYPYLAEAMLMAATPAADWLVVAPLALGLASAALLVMLRARGALQAPLAALVFALMAGLEFVLLYRVAVAGPVTMMMGNWLPPFGIAFTVDVLGALFALAAAIVGLVATVAATEEISARERTYGFYPLLLLLITGVSGAFFTGDIFNLYVWFEVLLISSFGLIILGGDRAQLDGATKYGFLNLLATTIFLIGVGLLYGATGTLNMADIVRILASPPERAPIGAIAALIGLGFAMKAAAFPLYFWLPASYHTPRLVVAGVFAGLLTKVGIYALLRAMVMLFPEPPAQVETLFVWIAVLTMLTGVLGALAQSDIRRACNYLVVSGIGYMLLGLALRSADGLTGTVFYALHSIVAMTALYLMAGIIWRMGRDFDMGRLGGLYAASPFVAALFLILGLAVSGLPPFSGFWPKVVLVKAAVAEGAWLAVGAIIVTGILTTIALGRFWVQIFWRGGPIGTPDGAAAGTAVPVSRDLHAAVLGPVALLVGLIVLFGVWPEPLLAAAAKAAAGLLDPSAYIASVFGSGA